MMLAKLNRATEDLLINLSENGLLYTSNKGAVAKAVSNAKKGKRRAPSTKIFERQFKIVGCTCDGKGDAMFGFCMCKTVDYAKALMHQGSLYVKLKNSTNC